MTIIVDTNIVFGALITPDGKLARILTDNRLSIDRISMHYMVTELSRHLLRIAQFSKKSADSVTEDLYEYLKFIKLYDETMISAEHWVEANRLTKGVDSDDITFVALALQTGGLLWTGDKKLTTHLKAMGFDRVVNTAELTLLLYNG